MVDSLVLRTFGQSINKQYINEKHNGIKGKLE
jgi:hypothetical protein